MTLSVKPMTQNSDGTYDYNHSEAWTPPHNELFGVSASLEHWIQIADDLHLPLLRRLSEGLPVYWYHDELDALEAEAQAVLAALPNMSSDEERLEYFGFRLGNLLDAIRQARDAPNGSGAVSVG